MKYISIFEGYNPDARFCKQKDCVSRTIQDAKVDIPSLMVEFNFKLDDLFDKFNNRLLYESEIGVFVDELNANELKEYNDRLAKQKAAEDEKKKNDELFEQWKAEIAKKVAAARESKSESSPTPTEVNK